VPTPRAFNSATFRVHRVRSSTHTPPDTPDSNRDINCSHSGRTTFGFHADLELSLNTRPTGTPRRSKASRPISSCSSTLIQLPAYP
jgi:hypothetical protein